MKPRIVITLGDPAGIGPEVAAKAVQDRRVLAACDPVVVGDPVWMRRALELVRAPVTVHPVATLGPVEARSDLLPCLQCSSVNLSQVEPGRMSAAAGQAAFDFLCTAIDRTLAGDADGIVTAPLHKEGLRAAGLPYPGHTEILAERTGTKNFYRLKVSKT